jgi:hypothetical protein
LFCHYRIITITTHCVVISLSLSPLTVVDHIITVTTHCVVISFITTVTTQHVSCITARFVVITHIIITSRVMVLVVVVVVVCCCFNMSPPFS